MRERREHKNKEEMERVRGERSGWIGHESERNKEIEKERYREKGKLR